MNDETKYIMRLQELLYQCVVELEYVQSVENCSSGLCASAKGKDLVSKGMDLLQLEDLSKETLFPKSWQVKV